MVWVKEWNNEPIPEVNPPNEIKQVWYSPPAFPIEEWTEQSGKPIADAVLHAWDLGTGDKSVTALIKDGKIEKVYNNLTPTHDPYTNPNAHIYYQCNCGAILDPGTKSFAALNNAAMNAGWKVRWGATSYVPYCVECGKDVE